MTIHPQSDVQSRQIGDNTRIWQYCVVLPGAVIGSDCNLCANVLVENDVRVGDRVTVKSGVQLWDGLTIEDDVFIGPNVTFSNDPFPRSRQRPADYARTIVHKGASIGANATVLPGISIGEHAMVAAGAVVTRNVPAYGIVIGNPARITGYVDTDNTHRLQASPHIPKSAGKKITELAGCFVHELPQIEDLRGNLSVIEFQKDVPFEVKRCFWVYGVPGREVRGEHAHFKCHQFVMCVAGSVQLVLDNGLERAQVSLDRPSLGVHIPPMKWGVQYKYSDDAVLVVFASHLYDAEDYIRDYGSFLHHVRQLRAA
jgi:UDP-2-acetamido-3-amino-2,3-dideoxy-glucuronate N-acetyltransferase